MDNQNQEVRKNENPDLENRFSYHPVTLETGPKYEAVRNECKELAYKLTALCPPSRELSLALTHLEDVMYSANAAIARHSNA